MNNQKSQSKPTDSEQGSGKGLSVQRLVLPFFRVILSRLEGKREWRIVANPRWDYFSRAESAILDNEANDYAEHSNCGVVYRMIRAKDWLRYGDGELSSAWTLDPRQNAQEHRASESE
jgi:hypothetical protein